MPALASKPLRLIAIRMPAISVAGMKAEVLVLMGVSPTVEFVSAPRSCPSAREFLRSLETEVGRPYQREELSDVRFYSPSASPNCFVATTMFSDKLG